MNPFFPIPVLATLAVAALLIAATGAWRGSVGTSASRRAVLTALRLAAISGLLVLLLNPGKWVRPTEEHPRPWLVLADASASMARADSGEKSRAATAADLVRQAARASADAGLALRVHPFSSALQAHLADVASAKLPAPTGDSTRLIPAISQALQDTAATGAAPAGIVVLSDGRQTLPSAQAELDALALRARSHNVPVHTVAIGDPGPPPDLTLVQPRAALTAFAGQALRIPFALKSASLPAARQTVTLRDESGAELAAVTLDLPPEKTVAGSLQVQAPAASARWTLDTPVIDGEVRAANNRSSLNIQVLASKTRVFIVEGAPYWDSKFLAQLLRQQPHMDVRSVHRLSENRYFRIDSGSAETPETDHPVFPANLDELARYDLIVFGKNIDPFLTPERAEALRAFVRDTGGAVLFARGKSTTTNLPAIEALEPVVWGAAMPSEFRFTPTADGEASGLFGQALPAPDASLWASLPLLKDGRAISQVKPFTRILAVAAPESTAAAGHSGRVPVLLARRYGQGVTGLVNGDGLWKWDFFPEARELGNCYEDFWTQLIQWLAAYSEFLPGQDFSLHLPSSRGETGVPMTARIAYRGAAKNPAPILGLTSPDGGETRLTPAAVTDSTGRPAWHASFTPDRPGTWKLRVIDPQGSSQAAPEALVNVPAPPSETDDLSPDPAFLASLAKATGGEALAPADFPRFLATHFVKNPPATRESGAVWQPAWPRAPIALALSLVFAAEWFLRRRQGLA